MSGRALRASGQLRYVGLIGGVSNCRPPPGLHVRSGPPFEEGVAAVGAAAALAVRVESSGSTPWVSLMCSVCSRRRLRIWSLSRAVCSCTAPPTINPHSRAGRVTICCTAIKTCVGGHIAVATGPVDLDVPVLVQKRLLLGRRQRPLPRRRQHLRPLARPLHIHALLVQAAKGLASSGDAGRAAIRHRSIGRRTDCCCCCCCCCCYCCCCGCCGAADCLGR